MRETTEPDDRGATASQQPADPMWRALLALGITQITAWGTSYYCLGVLAQPISKELGWSRGFVFLGFTVSVLTMALISTVVGRAIDRFGGRVVMTIGSALTALAVALLSLVGDEATYLAVWVLMGVGMRLCLYDAAFAAIVQVTPSRGRTAISYLTLFGAFASSVFWIAGHYLEEAIGWRQTLMVFAGLNLFVCLPLHWFGLAHREASAPAAAASSVTSAAQRPLEGNARVIAMVLFALVMSLNGFAFGIVSVQLVPILEAAGLATAAAVWMASMKGVAQFGGRVVEIVFGRNLSALAVGRVSMAAMMSAFGLLYLSGGGFGALLAFTLLMGAAQGVLTIVRGAVPLALFGAKGYGTVTGIIATPILFVSACSPTAFAAIVDRWGWSTGNLAVLIAAIGAFLCMEVLCAWHRRHLARHAP